MDIFSRFIVTKVAFILFTVCLWGVVAFPCLGSAVDCGAAIENLATERNLLKKHRALKGLVEECAADPYINFSYGYSLERLGRYEEALVYYQKASEIDPDSGEYHFGMADIYLNLGQDEHAMESLEKGLVLNDDNVRAQRQLDDLRIKAKSIQVEAVSSEEVVVVMAENDVQPYTEGASDDPPLASDDTPLLSMQIPYGRSSNMLSGEAQALLDTVGWALNNEKLRDANFEIIGHTDSIGDVAANLLLSKQRAEAVKDYLVRAHQIEGDRLRVLYFGDSQPLVPNTTEENRAINRRVEIKRVSGF